MTDKSIKDLPPVLSTKEVAEVLGISVGTTYKILGSGALKSVRVRRQIRVTREALLTYLNSES